MFSFHPIDYLRNGTIFGGRLRYRILSEIGNFLGLSPIEVYRIGRSFFDNCNPKDFYNEQYIVCRYAFVSVSPMKTFEPLFEYVSKGKVLDFGSGIGICFDAIRDNLHYEKYFLDIPGPAFDFVKFKYPNSYFIQAPCNKFGEAYGLIVLTDVLEHLIEPTKVLENIINALKPGAYLLYYFATNKDKPGHLLESIKKKPDCDLMLCDTCHFVCYLKNIPKHELWQKKRVPHTQNNKE